MPCFYTCRKISVKNSDFAQIRTCPHFWERLLSSFYWKIWQSFLSILRKFWGPRIPATRNLTRTLLIDMHRRGKPNFSQLDYCYRTRPAFPPPPPPFDVNNNYVGQANRNLKFKSKGPATPLTRSITTNTFAVEQKKEKSNSILRTFDLISWLRNKRSNPAKPENMTKSMHDLPGLSTFDPKNLFWIKKIH